MPLPPPRPQLLE
ncbi:Sorbitol dehydrogenase [Zea mays]|nr:Sorbitol dehydrogenase [Zea mays]